MAKRGFNKRLTAKARGYRSGLEEVIQNELQSHGIDGEYEKHKVLYTKPITYHEYTPDFRLPNGIFVETKGRFVIEDRKKHILIKEQHPQLDIRFVFQNSKNKIRKGSKTTYADWCTKHGFKYADKAIPIEWLSEVAK
jgi:hypothetical protein